MTRLLPVFGTWIMLGGCSASIAGAATEVVPAAGIPQPRRLGCHRNAHRVDATLTRAHGDRGQLASQSLAGIITITGSSRAIEAYRWLLGSDAPYLDAVSLARSPQFAIVPRGH